MSYQESEPKIIVTVESRSGKKEEGSEGWFILAVVLLVMLAAYALIVAIQPYIVYIVWGAIICGVLLSLRFCLPVFLPLLKKKNVVRGYEPKNDSQNEYENGYRGYQGYGRQNEEMRAFQEPVRYVGNMGESSLPSLYEDGWQEERVF